MTTRTPRRLPLRRPVRAAAATAVAVAAMAAAAALPAGTAPATSAAPAPAPSPTPSLLATALLSPARLPRTLQGLWAGRRLDGLLAQAMSATSLGAAAAHASCAEVSQGGEVVFADNPDKPVLPASNMKLVTVTALLDRLGTGYRFTTTVEAQSQPVNGVVDGDLYLVGGGDPLLRLPSYAAALPYAGPVYTDVTRLVALLKEAGVVRVTGSVVGDESRYDSLRTVASWPATYGEEGDVGPLSALDIDDGTVTARPLVAGGAPPPVQAAGGLTLLMDQTGVPVGGHPGQGTAPAGALVLARLASPPLSQVLQEVLRESDNTAMELMTKNLGLKVGGVGSTAAGVAAVRADLGADRLPSAALPTSTAAGYHAWTGSPALSWSPSWSGQARTACWRVTYRWRASRGRSWTS